MQLETCEEGRMEEAGQPRRRLTVSLGRVLRLSMLPWLEVLVLGLLRVPTDGTHLWHGSWPDKHPQRMRMDAAWDFKHLTKEMRQWEPLSLPSTADVIATTLSVERSRFPRLSGFGK